MKYEGVFLRLNHNDNEEEEDKFNQRCWSIFFSVTFLFFFWALALNPYGLLGEDAREAAEKFLTKKGIIFLLSFWSSVLIAFSYLLL